MRRDNASQDTTKGGRRGANARRVHAHGAINKPKFTLPRVQKIPPAVLLEISPGRSDNRLLRGVPAWINSCSTFGKTWTSRERSCRSSAASAGRWSRASLCEGEKRQWVRWRLRLNAIGATRSTNGGLANEYKNRDSRFKVIG